MHQVPLARLKASIEVDQCVATCDEILKSGALATPQVPGTWRLAAFTLVMINLVDLLKRADALGFRVSFVDDVVGFADVTELAIKIRNAACHQFSPLHDVEGSTVKFATAFGRSRLMKINSIELASDYEDDVAFFFGPMRIYLRRHIARALQEVLVAFNGHYSAGLTATSKAA